MSDPDVSSINEITRLLCQVPQREPYEMGWDAWVALGTLALAGVTVLAIVVPLIVDAIKARRRHKKESRIVATSLDEEYSTLALEVAELREELSRRGDPGFVRWDFFLKDTLLLDAPITDQLFDEIFKLDIDAALFVARTRSALERTKRRLRPYAEEPYALVSIAFDPVLPMILELQRLSQLTWCALSRLADPKLSTISVPIRILLTPQEIEFKRWYDDPNRMESAKPQWPSDFLKINKDS